MIRSFDDALTQALFEKGCHRKVSCDVYRPIRKAFSKLDCAVNLSDLRFPPVKKSLFQDVSSGRWGMWFYMEYCLTFEWDGNDALKVRFEDRR